MIFRPFTVLCLLAAAGFGWNLFEVKRSTAQLDRELVSQVAYLAVEAYRREEISRGKLLDISTKLGLSGNKLVSLAKAASAESA